MTPPGPFPEREVPLRGGRVVRFRSARPEDASLFLDYYAGLSARSRDFMHGWDAVDPSALALRTRSSDHCALVAVDPTRSGRIVGYCWIDGLCTTEVPMLGIGIVDEFHEVGMGKLLMRAALELAAAQGIPRICLGVWTDNARGVHVYRAVGFRDFPEMPAQDFSGRMELYMVADTGCAGPPPPRRFVLVDLSGSHQEIGWQHGTLLRNQITRSLGVMRALLPGTPEAAAAYAAASVPYCREHASELMEEVDGIAEGAGVSPADIFTLNASLDLILSRSKWAGRVGGATVAPDCWALALGGGAPDGRSTFVAWTAEDSGTWLDSCVLLRVAPTSAPPCLVWTFAGFVGRPGMSRHLALGAVARVSDDCGQGMPYPFVCRKALACGNVVDAARAIEGYRRMAGMDYVLADDRGGVALLGTSAGRVRSEVRASGRVASAGRWAEARLPRLEGLFSGLRGAVTREAIESIASDHGPGDLCPHDEGAACLTSLVADLRDASVWASHGSPCRNRHVRYAL